jgi:prepilin-type N-terminal cleavage/methylation domain-containing protein
MKTLQKQKSTIIKLSGVQNKTRLPRTRKSGAGFTLIELLVVVAIIGLLAAILLVGISMQREKALNTNLIQNLRQFRVWTDLYKATYNQYPEDVCPGPGGNCRICNKAANSNWSWPPVDLQGPDPFKNGLPALKTTWGGCMAYYGVVQSGSDEGYELSFGLKHINEKHRIDNNKALISIFNLVQSETEGPCEWYNEYLDTCIVQFGELSSFSE